MSKKKQHHPTQPHTQSKVKSDYNAKDAQETRKFFTIVAVVTVLLVVLLYFIFVR